MPDVHELISILEGEGQVLSVDQEERDYEFEMHQDDIEHLKTIYCNYGFIRDELPIFPNCYGLYIENLGPIQDHCIMCGFKMCKYCLLKCNECGASLCIKNECSKVQVDESKNITILCQECSFGQGLTFIELYGLYENYCTQWATFYLKNKIWKETHKKFYEIKSSEFKINILTEGWSDCIKCGKRGLSYYCSHEKPEGLCKYNDNRYSSRDTTFCEDCSIQCKECKNHYCNDCWKLKDTVPFPCGDHRHCNNCFYKPDPHLHCFDECIDTVIWKSIEDKNKWMDDYRKTNNIKKLHNFKKTPNGIGYFLKIIMNSKVYNTDNFNVNE